VVGAHGFIEEPPVTQAHFRRDVFYIRVIHALVDWRVSMAEQTSEERPVDQFVPCLVRCHRGRGLESIPLGHPLLDDYLAFVAVRAGTNTWLAVASDLKIFFGVVAKEPTEVTPADVF